MTFFLWKQFSQQIFCNLAAAAVQLAMREQQAQALGLYANCVS